MKTTTRRTRYNLKERIIAHILKHLMTTVPMLMGCAIVLYGACTYQYSWAGLARFGIEFAIGGTLFILGALIGNYFEN